MEQHKPKMQSFQSVVYLRMWETLTRRPDKYHRHDKYTGSPRLEFWYGSWPNNWVNGKTVIGPARHPGRSGGVGPYSAAFACLRLSSVMAWVECYLARRWRKTVHWMASTGWHQHSAVYLSRWQLCSLYRLITDDTIRLALISQN